MKASIGFAAGLLVGACLFMRVAVAQEAAAPPAVVDNAELTRMFEQDQADRTPGPKGIDWDSVAPRDEARLKRARELYATGALRTGADWLHAALIFQHSDEADDYLLAHEMCVAALALGEKRAKWLVAATEDRFLRAIGRPQRFGTQYVPDESGRFQVAPTDERVTDGLRAAHGVPPLAAARERAAKIR